MQDALRGRVARLLADGGTDLGFGNGLTGANSNIFNVIYQPDGKIIVSGFFTNINGTARSRIARLWPDGSLDSSFLNGQSGANDAIYASLLLTNGQILISGNFTNVNGSPRGRIARLNADGTVDSNYMNGLSGANSLVKGMVLQPDGRIVLFGGFTNINGTARNRMARLNSDGTLDPNFMNGQSGPSGGAVLSAAVQADGKVLIGGNFSVINGFGRNYVARLNSDGSFDTNFLAGMDGPSDHLWTVALQSDGQILIGGRFTYVNATSRGCIARLNLDGSVDESFMNGLPGTGGFYPDVNAIQQQPNGKIVIGGLFSAVHGVQRRCVARLNLDGSLDTSFGNGAVGPDGVVLSCLIQSEGKILVGGAFTNISQSPAQFAARLNTNGSPDTTFQNGMMGANDYVTRVALQNDGKVLVGGNFSDINGRVSRHLARLSATGALDTTFLNNQSGIGPAQYVSSLAALTNGQILVGGWYGGINGVARSNLARLNYDGSLDTNFLRGMAGPNDSIDTMGVQPDGRIIVGGYFTVFNGISRSHLARLNVDGSVDTNFLNGMTGPDRSPYALALQTNGQVLIGGDFTFVNGTSLRGLARLNTDGSLDPNFTNGLSDGSGINALAVQLDGRILAGGNLRVLNNTNRGSVARLNSDGSLDNSFLVGTTSLTTAFPTIYTLAIQADGNIIVGGAFSSFNGEAAQSIVRLYGAAVPQPLLSELRHPTTLELSWPSSYVGWGLDSQTNLPPAGAAANWNPVNGSTGTNRMFFPLQPSVQFFRLARP